MAEKTPAKKKCSVKACGRDASAKGMCTMHYTREYRKDPEKLEKARQASRNYAAKKRAKREAPKAEVTPAD